VAEPRLLRRYLDNAATSWPKPEPVLAAWERAAREIGAAAGRAAYRAAAEADSIRSAARSRVAKLLGGVDPVRVAFPGGATLALNLAIHGLVRPGDHVIATAADHNATLRPLHWLATRGVIETTIIPCDAIGRVDPAAVAAAWRPATRLVVASHVSNVTGAMQDAAALAAIAHDRGGLLLLDASQSLGLVPDIASSTNADIIAAPAHKWLLGTSGVGILWARAGVEPDPIIQGGTGTASDTLDMPAAFADRFEAGTPDVPALAALAAAIDWLAGLPADRGGALGRGRSLARGLAADCAARLRSLRRVRVIASPDAAGIVSFTVEGYDPAEIAMLLEQMAGVQARSGFHCAARVHEHLGTASGGTVRLSFGPFNTGDDVEATVAAMATLVST
jgi:selenocysteine lyase/cysteine desulfurase